jgi:hypothetical protein
MALTDVITDELLKTLETDTDPQTVLARYAGSKGPLYSALARATRDATARYATLQQRVTRARRRVAASEHRAQEAEARAGRTEAATQAAEHRLAVTQAAVAQHQGTVQQVQALAAGGWTTEALATLTTLFTRATADQAHPPDEVVTHCLAVMQAAADLAAAEQQVRSAQDQARQAEAAAVAKAQAAKVRAQAVDAAAWCLRHGIGAPTLTAWQAIATTLDRPAADLAHSVATALDRYGTLEAACQAQAIERDALVAEVQRLRAATKRLRADQARLEAALTAVHDNGAARVAAAETAAVAAIRTTAQRAQQTLGGLDAAVAAALERVAAVEREASAMRQYVTWAQALVDPDPAAWDGVGPEAWLALVGRWQQWVHRQGVAPEVPLPADLAPTLTRQAQWPTLYGPVRLPLPALSAWLAQGVATLVLEERPATLPVLHQEDHGNA